MMGCMKVLQLLLARLSLKVSLSFVERLSFGKMVQYCMLDFLFQGVLDRFSQIQPKVIFSVEAVRYNGKIHDHMTKLREVVKGLPDLEKVVLFPFCGSKDIQIADIPNW